MNTLIIIWRPANRTSIEGRHNFKTQFYIIFQTKRTHHLMLGSKHSVTGHTTQAGERQAELQEETQFYKTDISHHLLMPPKDCCSKKSHSYSS